MLSISLDYPDKFIVMASTSVRSSIRNDGRGRAGYIASEAVISFV